MIIVTGTFQMPADAVETFKTAAAAMVAETVKEEGCIEYQFWQSTASPTTFRVYEEWETDAHLVAHGQTAHMATFRGVLGGIEGFSRSVKKMEAGAATQL